MLGHLYVYGFAEWKSCKARLHKPAEHLAAHRRALRQRQPFPRGSLEATSAWRLTFSQAGRPDLYDRDMRRVLCSLLSWRLIWWSCARLRGGQCPCRCLPTVVGSRQQHPGISVLKKYIVVIYIRAFEHHDCDRFKRLLVVRWFAKRVLSSSCQIRPHLIPHAYWFSQLG